MITHFGNAWLRSQDDLEDFIKTQYTYISGSLIISGDDITELDGIRSLKVVSDNLTIIDNGNLLSLYGLHELINVGGKVCIANNDNLGSLNWLSNLVYIENDFIVYNNKSLISYYGVWPLLESNGCQGDIMVWNNKKNPKTSNFISVNIATS